MHQNRDDRKRDEKCAQGPRNGIARPDRPRGPARSHQNHRDK